MENGRQHKRQVEYRTWFKTDNPEHLLCKYRELSFEVLGGVNTESYVMLRVMLVVKGNDKIEREHIDLYNNYQRITFIKRVAEKIGFSLEYVEEAFKKLTNELEDYKHVCIEKRKEKYEDSVTVQGEERSKAKSVLESPRILHRISSLIKKSGVIGNEENSLILFLTYISRLQHHPIHSIIQSNYHYLQTKIGELVPDEHKLMISHLSDNALYYFDEDELAHKLLLVEDTGSNKQKLLPLLELQAKGRLIKTITQKDALGKLKTVQRNVNGPICLSISTAHAQQFSQNATRSFNISEDTSKEQDERIMTYQRKKSAGLIKRYEEDNATLQLWNIQRMLTPIHVINPYAEHLVLPESLKHKQISNGQYLRFIELITFIKQFQKEHHSDKRTGELYIETDTNDIEQAHELLKNVLAQKCDDLNTNTRSYFELLKGYLDTKEAETESKTFTNRELQTHTRIPISTIKRYHQTLLSKGYIEATGEGNRATGFSYRIARNESFKDLKTNITKTLNTAINIIKDHGGSPKPTVAQKMNGLPQTTNTNGLS